MKSIILGAARIRVRSLISAIRVREMKHYRKPVGIKRV